MASEPATKDIGDEPTFDALGLASSLLRTISACALATLDRASGYPLATLTTLALDHDAVPLILISELSEHTRNLQADPRFSLLLASTGKGDPLTHPRLTLIGRAEITLSPAAKENFISQRPKAKLYADFLDFSLWRLVPDRIHLNGGFGKAHAGPAEPLLAHMRRTASH